MFLDKFICIVCLIRMLSDMPVCDVTVYAILAFGYPGTL